VLKAWSAALALMMPTTPSMNIRGLTAKGERLGRALSMIAGQE
jgi:hypothetical protein